MLIDLHIHTKTGSDGAMTMEEVFAEAKRRNIKLISITDHDNIVHQGRAEELAEASKIRYVTGVECWHSRNDKATTTHYIEFCQKHNLMMTGGSDCHQKPILMGTIAVEEWVKGQF